MLTEHSAGAIIFRKENDKHFFLILSYEEGHWGAPKGHVEKAETLQQTALREIREETGLTRVQLLPGFELENHYFYRKDGQLSSKTVTFFLGKANGEEVRLSSEHINYAWLPFPEAYARVTFKSEKEIWQAANEFLLKRQSG